MKPGQLNFLAIILISNVIFFDRLIVKSSRIFQAIHRPRMLQIQILIDWMKLNGRLTLEVN